VSAKRLSAAGAGLLGGVGEELEALRPLAAGLGGAGGRGGVEHVLEHGRVMSSVGAVPELAGDVDGADRAHGLDPVIAGGGAEHVAAGGADTEGADAVRIDFAAGGEEGYAGLEVLDAVGGVFQAAGFAATLALVGRVVGEGDRGKSPCLPIPVPSTSRPETTASLGSLVVRAESAH
jgi:hypothetical protein